MFHSQHKKDRISGISTNHTIKTDHSTINVYQNLTPKSFIADNRNNKVLVLIALQKLK